VDRGRSSAGILETQLANQVQVGRKAADIEVMVIPIRILALVLTASALACAAMTLVLLAERA